MPLSAKNKKLQQPTGVTPKKTEDANISIELDDPNHDVDDDDDPGYEVRGLLGRLRIRRNKTVDGDILDPIVSSRMSPSEWLRPYWLGVGLFLVLLPFWILDTLKDPIFGALTGGNLDVHQPVAKMLSVGTTLVLVCFLEYVSHASERRQRQKHLAQHQLQQQQQEQERPEETAPSYYYDSTIPSHESILDGGGIWSKMSMQTSADHYYDRALLHTSSEDAEDRVPSSIFTSIGVPYCIAFGIMAYLLQFNSAVATSKPLSSSSSANAVVDEGIDSAVANSSSNSNSISWHVLGYFLYAAIESFGSLAVATFWSFTNSTLSLHDAERYYGLIIAVAQLGAIVGSTMVTTNVWNNITLIIVACLTILLHVIVMNTYSRRFPPTNDMAAVADEEPHPTVAPGDHGDVYHDDQDDPGEVTLWSGVYLILKHNYVLYILGASCLYEVSLTCLNYQMTLLGWNRFEETPHQRITFTQFMGHYGQMVNVFSLLLSSIIFPLLIRRLGLRWTLRLFPTLLLLANFLAFGPLPGNLWLLFVSLSCLKAMTYSIHDPSKELLYLPTSNPIKFKAKFWIDVVGARVAKAIGSSINTLSGSVDRSIQVASAPSLLTAAALWFVCFRVGWQFEKLVATGTIVGMEEQDQYDTLRRCSRLKATTLDGEEEEEVEDDHEEEDGVSMQILEDTMLQPDFAKKPASNNKSR